MVLKVHHSTKCGKTDSRAKGTVYIDQSRHVQPNFRSCHHYPRCGQSGKMVTKQLKPTTTVKAILSYKGALYKNIYYVAYN